MPASLTPPCPPSSQAEPAKGREKTDISTLDRARSQSRLVSRAPAPGHRLWAPCGLVVPAAFLALSSPRSDSRLPCHQGDAATFWEPPAPGESFYWPPWRGPAMAPSWFGSSFPKAMPSFSVPCCGHTEVSQQACSLGKTQLGDNLPGPLSPYPSFHLYKGLFSLHCRDQCLPHTIASL